MEADGQRYSVLAMTEVREKMMKEIDQISEVFSVSKSDATVILIHLRWDTFKASDLLGDKKEKFLAELGLVVQAFDTNSSCADHETTLSDGVGDHLVSTPFCSHKYSTTRWSEYLTDSLEKNKEKRGLISCLRQDCLASVGPDTIEKLTEPVKEMYENYILGSFMESNKGSMKWCPAEGCGYVLEINEETEEIFGLVCLCGHIFCWKCRHESHTPVTCNNASLWLSHSVNQSRSLSWIHTNTKRCPNCNTHVQKNGDPDYMLITCICSWSFCWFCLRTKEEHRGKWDCAEVDVTQEKAEDSSSNEFVEIVHLNQWDACQKAMDQAKAKLKDMEETIIPQLVEGCALSDQDVRTVREAWMLVVQCRQVLKWSCVFDYFMTEYQSAKKQYLIHRRAEANKVVCKHEMALNELVNQALSAGDFACFKHKMETSTTSTGNFFHEFVKDLEDGLPEVKANAYENAPSGYWFCDRCTFQNQWVDTHCKMCVFTIDPPPHVEFEDNNSASVSDDQPVPQDLGWE